MALGNRSSNKKPVPQLRTPLSPETERFRKRLKEVERNAIKGLALEELMKQRKKNGGKAIRGDIQAIVKLYQGGGYDYVTKGVMYYLIAKHKKALAALALKSCRNVTIKQIITTDDGSSISDMTNKIFDDYENRINNVKATDIAVANQRGRPNGDEAAEKERVEKAMMRAATLCLREKFSNADFLPGTSQYKEIIALVEQEENLPSGSISIGTVRRGILRGDLPGYKGQGALDSFFKHHTIQRSESILVSKEE